MSIYQITLLVTLEQKAIVKLFREMQCVYKKTGQRDLLDQDSFPDNLSHKLSETHDLTTQGGTNIELFQPVPVSDAYTSFPLHNDIPQINEIDGNTQLDHCHRVAKVETSVADNRTPYGETCQETVMPTDRASVSSKDVLEPKFVTETSKLENANKTLRLDSQQSETHFSATSVENDTEVAFGVIKRKGSRAFQRRNVGLKTSWKMKISSSDNHDRIRAGYDKCKDCGKTFQSKANLERHQKNCHSVDKTFRRDECLFYYPSEIELYLHKLKKHNREEGKFPCPECPKVYGLAKTLRSHMQFMHLGNGLPCSFCGQLCKKEHLRTHEAIHRTSKDYKCDKCSSAFKRKAELKLHMKRHTNPYSCYCETCGQGCFGSKDLVEHKRIHTGEKPFACSICDYRCAHKPNLKIHMKVHNKSH